MAAKVLYTKKGSDPTTIVWPQTGPYAERFTFTSGTAANVSQLIGYPDGSITFADGRLFPPITSQGSTLKHQKN
jgi:hypothetical protein